MSVYPHTFVCPNTSPYGCMSLCTSAHPKTSIHPCILYIPICLYVSSYTCMSPIHPYVALYICMPPYICMLPFCLYRSIHLYTSCMSPHPSIHMYAPKHLYTSIYLYISHTSVCPSYAYTSLIHRSAHFHHFFSIIRYSVLDRLKLTSELKSKQNGGLNTRSLAYSKAFKVSHFPYMPYDFLPNITPIHVPSVSCYGKQLC